MAMVTPSRSVRRELLRQVCEVLSEHVRQDVRAEAAGKHEGIDAARGRDPDRRAGLDRAGEHRHVDRLACPVRDRHALPTPEAEYGLDRLGHDFSSPREVLRHEGEVVGVPAGCEGQSDTSARQLVDHRPVFRDAQRVVQRQHDAAGAEVHARRDGRKRRRGDRGVRIEAAEGVEVPFGGPDSGEAMLVCEAGTIKQQAVRIPRLAMTGMRREVEEAEFHHPFRARRLSHLLFDGRPIERWRDDHAKASRQRPEQFQNRDIERDAGDREPHPRR